jgi:allantoate deiminase
LSVDIRDLTAESLDRLVARVVEVATDIADRCDVDLSWGKTFSLAPTPADDRLRGIQSATMRDLNLAPFELPSGAGHDAMVLGSRLPMAMFFVRSENGISHNPYEFSSLDDCAIAARALARFLTRLTSDKGSS